MRGLSQPNGASVSSSSSRARASRASEHDRATSASPLAILARHAPLVVVGEAVPLLAAVVAMPRLVSGLGVDRLGVLSLAWVVIGYFSLFDLGIGRATTQLIAAHRAAGRNAAVEGVIATSLLLLSVLGVAGGLVLAALAPWLVGHALALPDDLLAESRRAFLVLALTVPLVVLSSGLRGVLEAERRFAAVAALRAVLGLISFLGPLLVLPYSRSLAAVVPVLAVGRVLLLAASVWLCRDAIAWRALAGGLDRSTARTLVRFGGWLTVSSAVSPLLVLLDRFVIGAVVSVGAVAFYATPLEVVQRAGVVPIAIGTVLFPALAASALRDARHARALYATALELCVLGVFPILLLVSLWAHEGLALWLGEAFARESSVVVRWVAPGLLLNAVGCASLFALQAAGRPDLPAKLHVLELVGYVPLLWWLAQRHGLEGAAIAWSVRVAIDALLLLRAALERFPLDRPVVVRRALVVVGGLACLAATPLLTTVAVKVLASVAVVLGAAALFAVLLGRVLREAADAAR